MVVRTKSKTTRSPRCNSGEIARVNLISTAKNSIPTGAGSPNR